VTYTTREVTPPAVAAGPKRGGEGRGRRAWAEPSVWTERMLTTLDNGVKGGVWFSLMDKVYSPKNLRAAWERVAKNDGAAGVDRQTVANFATQAESSLKWLHEQLRDGTYRPAAVRRKWISKPGTTKQRPLGIPTVRDRVVQTALRNVLEPIFECRFDDHSYGFRPGRGCKDGLRRVVELLRGGHIWVVDADVESYFDTIPRKKLMGEVRKEVGDGSLLMLLEEFLAQKVMDGMQEWEATEGTPQGAVISPLLANIYLHPVDVALRNAGLEVVRYADDLVILCKTEVQAQEALGLLAAQMSERGLKLHPEKTRVVDVTQPGGFDFLGYHFEQGRKTPRKKSLRNLKDNIKAKTPRNSGRSLADVIRRLNESLRGWYEYFKHAERDVFNSVDSFARRRLRGILKRFEKKRGGSAAGYANIKWPNAFFKERGLFSLAAAREAYGQSR